MTDLTEFFSATTPVVDPLWTDLVEMIRGKAAANPRNQQVELGPSEIGTPCVRRLAYGLLGAPRCNPEYDPLPSIIGTATHAWLQEAAEWHNTQLGYRRWLTETRVNVGGGVSGSSDLFDTETGTVIDHKVLGPTSYDKYSKDIGPTYRAQINLYGKGFQNAGYEVKRVAVAILPRSSTLSKMHLAIEDYDEALADSVIRRREQVLCLAHDMKVEENPERYAMFAKTPDSCIWCAQWSPMATGPLQCDGKVDTP